MKRHLLAAAAVLGLAVSASAANAATYFTYLDWSDQGGTVHQVSQANAYGKVTIVESANLLTLTVDLYHLAGFVNTGQNTANSIGREQPFTFSTDAAYNVTVQNTNDPNPLDSHNQTFYYGGHSDAPGAPLGDYEGNPFGHFTDYIGCCYSPTNVVNGSVAAAPPPLVFTIGGAGITVNDLLSNTDGATASPERTLPGHWWFQADVTTSFDGGSTFHIAAQDLQRLDGGVPEPASWALMLVGFGGLGAMLRRRRATALA